MVVFFYIKRVLEQRELVCELVEAKDGLVRVAQLCRFFAH